MDRQNYKVEMKYQFPAWNEKGWFEVGVFSARNKAEAIKRARRQAEDWTFCAAKGLQWFRAVETDEPETTDWGY